MNGLFLTIIMDNNLFLLEFFRFIRIGVAYINDGLGRATSLILGFWKLESNLTFVLRKKLHWQNHGQA